jgi:hypothetical protein
LTKIHTGKRNVSKFFQSPHGKINYNLNTKALKKMGIVENYEDIRNLTIMIVGGNFFFKFLIQKLVEFGFKKIKP